MLDIGVGDSCFLLPLLISHSFFPAAPSFLLASYAVVWFFHMTQSLFGGVPALMGAYPWTAVSRGGVLALARSSAGCSPFGGVPALPRGTSYSSDLVSSSSLSPAFSPLS